MEKIIEIPEGYEARIEGNKVVLELKESEDERIRKSVIGFLKTIASLKDGKTVSNEDFDSEALLEWASYLEKQKEPLTPEEKMSHPLYLEGFDVGKSVGEVVSKLAEWSEEDVEKLAKIRMSKSGTLKNEMNFYRQGVRDAFNYKGFRPSWKPSEEQMKFLEDFIYRIPSTNPNKIGIVSIYNDLKKLM